jgi:hypothetical protein
MTIDQIIALAGVAIGLLAVIGSAIAVLVKLGSFEGRVEERFKSIWDKFDIIHAYQNKEIADIKQSIARMDNTLSMVTADRMRIERVEEELRELRAMVAAAPHRV